MVRYQAAPSRHGSQPVILLTQWIRKRGSCVFNGGQILPQMVGELAVSVSAEGSEVKQGAAWRAMQHGSAAAG
jgi:hypothetical protein